MAQQTETTETAEFTAANILFDESHTDNASSLWAPGNLSLFGWVLEENGYNASTNLDEALDSGILASYDILVIFLPVLELTEGEVSAIQSFVTAGGGLLLVGVNNDNWWGYTSDNLNTLAATYDIQFNSDHVTGDATVLSTHNITHLVTVLGNEGTELDGCTLTLTGSAVSVASVSSGTIVGTAVSGSGRVVAVGSSAPFVMYRRLSSYRSDSHFQFSLNVIDWLAGNPAREVVKPKTAVIRAGPGPQLTEDEVEDYEVFVGLYHDHTTNSDGADSPASMLERGLSLGLDFMILTDHSHTAVSSVEGIHGALAARAIADTYGFNCQIIIGAELSSVKHTVGFPLTENIWTADQATAVAEIHAQGGIAVLAHPTLDYTYAAVFKNLDALGYDAFEVINDGFLLGSGEDGLKRPFLGASDSHSASGVGNIFNAVFVDSPAGPGASITDDDLKAAVLEKRVVVLDRMNNLVYGQAVWVNRFLELWEEAELAVADASDLLEDMKAQEYNVTFSQLYLDAAEIALEMWNPTKAISLAVNATSELALGLDLRLETPVLAEPNSEIDVTITLTNNHTYPVALNTSAFPFGSFSLEPTFQILNASGKSSTSGLRTGAASSYGYTTVWINVKGVDLPEYLVPVFLRHAGIIDNLTSSIQRSDAGYEVEFRFWIGRDNAESVSSATLYYNVGSGWSQTAMTIAWNYFYKTVDGLQSGANVSFYVLVVSPAGEFNLTQRDFTIPSGTTTPTIGPDYTTALLLGGGIGAVAVVVVVLAVIRTKRQSPG